MVSIKEEDTPRFLNLLVSGLHNCSANFWLSKVISVWVALPEDFVSEILKTIDVSPHWYLSYFGLLAILNALSCKNPSEAVLLGKSLKSP